MKLFVLVQQELSRIAKDVRGQDIVQYTLMAGLVAVSAGAMVPEVAANISAIFSQMGNVITDAALQG